MPIFSARFQALWGKWKGPIAANSTWKVIYTVQAVSKYVNSVEAKCCKVIQDAIEIKSRAHLPSGPQAI